jgi:zinc transport system substrate-binding protein
MWYLGRSVRKISLILIIAVSAIAVAGCGGTGSDGAGETVVAAFYPLAYAAQQIGGPGLTVKNLTPPGAEPHDLELTASDISAISNAAVVLYLGRGFQPGVEKAVKKRSGDSLDLLETETLGAGPAVKGFEGLDGGLDPHVWLDSSRYAAMVRKIGAALDRLKQGEALAKRAEALDAEYRQGLAHCARTKIVTSHAAFGYLAARYGLEQLPLAGLSPEAEPSPRALEALVDEVKESGTTTVFFETLVSPKLAETVARESGVKTAVLNPLEGLNEEQIADGADYFSVMRENLAVLREALGCT